MDASNEQKPEPLVSDASHHDAPGQYSNEESFAWAAGCDHTRDIYEVDRATNLARISELERRISRMQEAGNLCAAMLMGIGNGNYPGSYFFGADIRVDAQERSEAWDAASAPLPSPEPKIEQS